MLQQAAYHANFQLADREEQHSLAARQQGVWIGASIEQRRKRRYAILWRALAASQDAALHAVRPRVPWRTAFVKLHLLRVVCSAPRMVLEHLHTLNVPPRSGSPEGGVNNASRRPRCSTRQKKAKHLEVAKAGRHGKWSVARPVASRLLHAGASGKTALNLADTPVLCS